MSTTHDLTISTRLSDRTSAELMSYLQEWRTIYGKMLRYTWYHYARVSSRPKKVDFNAELQRVFHVTKRTANSVIFDAVGRFNALVELKKTECEQMRVKIESLEKTTQKLEKEVSEGAALAAKNSLSEEMLVTYRKQKKSLFYKHQRLNKLRNTLRQRELDIEAGRYRICFGSKKRFEAQARLSENGFQTHEAWKEDFVAHRDSHILFLGAKDERLGNQMFQLTRQEDGTFTIQCRKDGTYAGEKDKRYARGGCKFSYLEDKLAELLCEGKHGVSYRVRFVGKKIYLQAILSYDRQRELIVTNMCDGAIGLDYNDGFIQMSETNGSGNLVGQKKYVLRFHGTGTKAENEIRQTIAAISRHSLMTGKSIVCEKLDFLRTKSKAHKGRSERGKRYNRMIHLLDYSRYKDTLLNSAVRNGIDLILVNPAYTSKIAKEKYCDNRKLNVHVGAAYVIARKGQGFKDKLSNRK